MDYRKFGNTYYVRLDKGDEIVGSLLLVCKKERVGSAAFSGIGGCGTAEIQTFSPDTGEFETRELNGMLELISINGNIVSDGTGGLFHHTHALFSYVKDGRHRTAGGHIKSATVLYTAEIELRPVRGGVIRRKHDPETGTGFWDFTDGD